MNTKGKPTYVVLVISLLSASHFANILIQFPLENRVDIGSEDRLVCTLYVLFCDNLFKRQWRKLI